MASRLRETIEKSMDTKFSAIFHITDSTIVRWQIQKESHGFKTFVATRIGEIQSKTDPEEWWWVGSEFNPADLTTRGTPPNQLSFDSIWQNGPDFLKMPTESWPISKETPNQDVPDRKIVVMTTDAEIQALPVLQISRFSNYDKLLNVTDII